MVTLQWLTLNIYQHMNMTCTVYMCYFTELSKLELHCEWRGLMLQRKSSVDITLTPQRPELLATRLEY